MNSSADNSFWIRERARLLVGSTPDVRQETIAMFVSAHSQVAVDMLKAIRRRQAGLGSKELDDLIDAHEKLIRNGFVQGFGRDIVDESAASRTIEDAITQPIRGDVVEFRELSTCPFSGELFDFTSTLRVLACAEDLVWFKEYGKGRRNIVTQEEWASRISRGTHRALIHVAWQLVE